MTERITDELDLLRSILPSDDHLQIRPSGDFDQICLQLDYDIHISFFIDLLSKSTKSLTINNIHEFRIHKLANKGLLNNEQWRNIQNYFNRLVQQANPDISVYSIIELIQEYLIQFKPTEAKSNTITSISNEDASTPIQKFRGADLIFNRIVYDASIDCSKVIIGYEDRFTGIHEVPFHDFKKVHEDEFGIPMHRIRYYKINGHIVWDRIKKFDILTGSDIQYETHDHAEQGISTLVEGLYRFEPSADQWILCSHISLTSDDLNKSSLPEMRIPERCQFITWNILFDYYHSELIYTSERYNGILNTLKSVLPDVICLQEVTRDFLELLFNERWLKEKNYYIIIMGNILNQSEQQSYGQVMLTKNFRPRSFSICTFPLFDQSMKLREKQTKGYIIARFGLNPKGTIDLVNLHLHSNRSYDAEEKRCQSLEYLFKTMNTENYMLIGDFNFGDDNMQEQLILQRYQHQIHDLWTMVYDIDENPGYTFDPTRNTCARVTSEIQVGLRLDRYLLHLLHNLSYSIEHLNMIGLETIPIDSIHRDRINQSDHYGLQLILNFRTRTISHQSALAILPTRNIHRVITSSDEQYDPLYKSYSSRIDLFCPFFDLIYTEDDQENILLPLRLLLAQCEPFDIQIDSMINEQSVEAVKKLHEKIKQLFSQSLSENENNYKPHMTNVNLNCHENQEKSTSALNNPVQFPVRYIYILQQSVGTSFHMTYQLPLGSVLEQIGSNRSYYLNHDLDNFFENNNFYNDEKSYERKREKFHQLSRCVEDIFNKETLHCFTSTFLPYGSFRLGLNGEDLDTVFILSEQNSIEKKTDLDQTILQLRHDSLRLTALITDLLEKQIMNVLSNDILGCRRIQALYSIISILFHDQTRVEIFIQIKEKSRFNDQHPDKRSSLLNVYDPIHGVHDIERLIVYARFPPVFQYLLTFIRTWARNVGIYGQVYGYLGGYSWAILCAYICHSFVPSHNSLLTFEQFFILIQKFFTTYSHFNWSHESICLSTKIRHSDDNRGSMRIQCPTPPYNNSSRSTINSTRYLIIQSFQQVHQLIENSVEYENTLQDILQLSNQFPDKTIQSILQLTLSGQTMNELNQWIGYMKSRLAHFLTDCEEECDLFVQTDTQIEIRNITLERIYSIGFQIDEQRLSRHRQFYYTLNKFLDQFKLCPFRSDTMKISYKLMSIHDWKKCRIEK